LVFVGPVLVSLLSVCPSIFVVFVVVGAVLVVVVVGAVVVVVGAGAFDLFGILFLLLFDFVGSLFPSVFFTMGSSFFLHFYFQHFFFQHLKLFCHQQVFSLDL